MPLGMTYNEELGIIEVESFGNINMRELIEIKENVVEKFEELQVNRVLADITNQTSHINLMMIWEFGSTLWDVLSRNCRIAIVHSGEKNESLSLFITVVKNRGFIIDDFESKEEAIEWLVR